MKTASQTRINVGEGLDFVCVELIGRLLFSIGWSQVIDRLSLSVHRSSRHP